MCGDTVVDLIRKIEALLHGPGEPMSGSAMTNDEALEYGRATFNGAPFCLVRNWVWVDLDGPEEQREEAVACRPRIAVGFYLLSVSFESALSRFQISGSRGQSIKARRPMLASTAGMPM